MLVPGIALAMDPALAQAPVLVPPKATPVGQVLRSYSRVILDIFSKVRDMMLTVIVRLSYF